MPRIVLLSQRFTVNLEKEHAAPSSWNQLGNQLVSLNEFKVNVNNLNAVNSGSLTVLYCCMDMHALLAYATHDCPAVRLGQVKEIFNVKSLSFSCFHKGKNNNSNTVENSQNCSFGP